MRVIFLFLTISFSLASCQGNERGIQADTVKGEIPDSPKVVKAKTIPDTAAAKSITNNKQKLALTANALQLVNAVTGSTREIAFGMPFDQLVSVMNSVLEDKPTIGVNTECGAGPLKMATWQNGLTLVFKEKRRGDPDWVFAGWFAGKPTGKADRLTTMSGIGVGSSRRELEDAYVTTTAETTLGQEFSVKSGFYGLFSGTGKYALIDVMWSGTSCNFR